MRAAFLLVTGFAWVAGCSYDFDTLTPNGELVDSALVEDSSSADSSSKVDSTPPPVDSGTVDSTSPADTAVTTDTAVADTMVADTTVTDTTVADTMVADTMVADTAKTDTGAVSCSEPSGKLYNGHCYFPLTGVNGDAAKTACEGRGAHLVTITSAGEQTSVAALRPTADRWIGLRSTSSSSSASAFKWINGEAVSYTNWGGGQPNNSGLCVAMRTDGSWNDRDCAETNDAICERE